MRGSGVGADVGTGIASRPGPVRAGRERVCPVEQDKHVLVPALCALDENVFVLFHGTMCKCRPPTIPLAVSDRWDKVLYKCAACKHSSPVRPGPAYLEADASAIPVGDSDRAGLRSLPAAGLPPASAAAPVFPPRSPGDDPSRMVFPDGWEARLFSGVDPGFGAWSTQAWSAVVDLRFDADGIPQSVLLVQSSGLPDVDARLARSARGWRLLEAGAPRQGRVGWSGAAPARLPEAAP